MSSINTLNMNLMKSNILDHKSVEEGFSLSVQHFHESITDKRACFDRDGGLKLITSD